MHPKIKLCVLRCLPGLTEGSFRTLDSAHSPTYELYELWVRALVRVRVRVTAGLMLQFLRQRFLRFSQPSMPYKIENMPSTPSSMSQGLQRTGKVGWDSNSLARPGKEYKNKN